MATTVPSADREKEKALAPTAGATVEDEAEDVPPGGRFAAAVGATIALLQVGQTEPRRTLAAGCTVTALCYVPSSRLLCETRWAERASAIACRFWPDRVRMHRSCRTTLPTFSSAA